MPIGEEKLKARWFDEWSKGDQSLSWPDFYEQRKAARAKNRRWLELRTIVWERDKGVCDVCREAIADNFYELGHIVDRLAGGSDEPDNLVVMCVACNRHKPFHRSREEYEQWKADGGWIDARMKVISDVLGLRESKLRLSLDEIVLRYPSDGFLFIG